MFRPPLTYNDSLQVRITLRNIEPAIWRTLVVPADLPLSLLHGVIQIAFGWQDSHLHEFEVGSVRFGPIEGEDAAFLVDEQAAPLGAVARQGDTFLYRYDFGDEWQHDVLVEQVIANASELFSCTDGARACPPEDSGGPHGYERMLQVRADPKHPEHAELTKWLHHSFSPDKLDLERVNQQLREFGLRAVAPE